MPRVRVPCGAACDDHPHSGMLGPLSGGPLPVYACSLPALSSSSRSPTTMAKPATTKKSKPLSKSEILKAIADAVGDEVSAKHVKAVIEHLVALGHKELKKAGVFVLHGFAK